MVPERKQERSWKEAGENLHALLWACFRLLPNLEESLKALKTVCIFRDDFLTTMNYQIAVQTHNLCSDSVFSSGCNLRCLDIAQYIETTFQQSKQPETPITLGGPAEGLLGWRTVDFFKKSNVTPGSDIAFSVIWGSIIYNFPQAPGWLHHCPGESSRGECRKLLYTEVWPVIHTVQQAASSSISPRFQAVLWLWGWGRCSPHWVIHMEGDIHWEGWWCTNCDPKKSQFVGITSSCYISFDL